MGRIVFVSVVRDYAFYDRFFTNNPAVNRYVLNPIDNRSENLHITTRYNRFLDSYDFGKDAWFVFCHEDLEMKEDPALILEKLDKGALYGLAGRRLEYRKGWFGRPRVKSIGVGSLIHSDKNGDFAAVQGEPLPEPLKVDTVDCACLMVHSSLIEKTGLRFDESLSFDLYTEDFCIQAVRNFNIPTYAVDIRSQHWSKGSFSERFYKQLIRMNKKYKDGTYMATCAVIGKQLQPFKAWKRMTFLRLWLFFKNLFGIKR